MDMLHGDMLHGDMLHGDMLHGDMAAWRHRYATWTSSMDKKHEHAAWTWTCSIYVNMQHQHGQDKDTKLAAEVSGGNQLRRNKSILAAAFYMELQVKICCYVI
jgi:hypothetical protein